VVILVCHCAWWLVTGSGHPERLTVRGEGLTRSSATGFSWHGKKKEKPPNWTRDPIFVLASLRATEQREGGSRQRRNQKVSRLVSFPHGLDTRSIKVAVAKIF
jgi:hypothetical protein